MVFSSTVFLFLFLPAVLALYLVAPTRLRNPLLLAASLLFYAWGEVFFVGVMLASIAVNYLAALQVERFRGRPAVRWVLAAAVAANLGLLGTYKYANFIVANLNHLLAWLGASPVAWEPVHLPIGISFFTFQAISYVIDVHRGVAPARNNPLHVALYISMFPQLIAGPIVRYGTVARQLVERTVTLDGLYLGAQRFVVGLGKKVLIANPVGAMADGVFAVPQGDLTAGLAWLGIAGYTLQIYFDFSGYSDMAIGLGRMFGFGFPENFNYPYVSASIREFWRRWHMSLSSWFRDYVYIPLGGNRRGGLRTHLNLLTVFLLCGLWHGAAWNFVIWGLWHGAFLVLERGRLGRWLQALPAPFRHAYALLVVMVGWVFFRLDTMPQAVGYLAAMAGLGAGSGATYHVGLYLDNAVGLALAAGAVGALPVAPALGRLLQRPGAAWGGAVGAVSGAALAAVLVASAVGLAAGTYNPFIYFRF